MLAIKWEKALNDALLTPRIWLTPSNSFPQDNILVVWGVFLPFGYHLKQSMFAAWTAKSVTQLSNPRTDLEPCKPVSSLLLWSIIQIKASNKEIIQSKHMGKGRQSEKERAENGDYRGNRRGKIKMERQKQEWLREERDRSSSGSSSNSTTLGVLAERYK